MNMISTGSFLEEMKSSVKQPSHVEKFLAVWEKKNTKAAKAGGLSLMALSLAACGGSSSTTDSTDTGSSDPAPTTPTTPATPAAAELTTAAADVLTLASGQDLSGLISSTASKTTFNAGDEASSVTGSGATFTLEDASGGDITTSETGDIRNFDNIVYNINSLAVGGSAQVEIAVTDFAKAKTYSFDNIYDGSIINDIVLTGTTNASKITTSSDFSALKVTPATSTFDVEVDMSAAANTLTVVNSGDLVANATGTLSTTASTSAGLVKLTSTGNNTVVDATAATSLFATSTEGAVTITDGNSALLVDVNAAKGATLTDVAAVTNLDVVAGGNVSVTNTGAGDMNIATTGTITTAGTVNSTTGTFSSVGASSIKGNALTTITVSGNGGAADYTMSVADHAALTKIIVEGDQDVTVAANPAELGTGTSGALAIDDNGSGTFKLDLESTAGAVVLSGDIVDDLNLKVNMAANDLTVVTGQAVDVAVSQATASDFIVGTAANAASNTITVNLDDSSTSNGTAVDLTALTISQAKTVTINAGLDINTNGDASVLNTVTASTTGSTMTINGGANGFTITDEVGAGSTVALTGSGNVTLLGSTGGTIEVNATTLDGSALTGRLITTAGDEITGTVTTVKSGSGNDTILLGANTITDVSTGAGNDGVTLDDADYGTKVVNLAFGDGTDTLTFVNGAKLSDLASGSSVTGLDAIVFNSSSTTQEIDADLLSGKTYAVSASATGATGTINVIVGTSDTAIDLSTLVEATDVSTTTAAMTAAISAASNTAAITITGMSGAKNSITGSSSASDVLTGGAYADTFNISSDGLLFNASNVMLDTIAGGASAASTYDVLSVGTNGTAFTVVAADDFSKLTGVEQITAVSNTAAISLTLGATAETAGITRVTLAADTAGTEANVVDMSAYTAAVNITGSGGSNTDTLKGGAGADTISGGAGVDTITGNAGADTITGAAGADVISAGAGDDILVYATDALLFTAGNAVEDSIAGGDGTDIIRIGTTGTKVTIGSSDAWTRASSVETIEAVANTATISITLANSAYTSGIRTVDISAGTAASGNVINADTYSGLYEAALTLTGSATGVTTINGGDGADTITGGTGADVLTGGLGGDTIYVGTGVGADVVEFDHAGETAEWTDGYGSTSVATTGMDIIYGLNAGDDIKLTDYTNSSAAGAADGVLVQGTLTVGADLGVSNASNTVKAVRGDYSTNVFAESATGADLLFVFDADDDQTNVDYEAFVAIGIGANTISVDSSTTGGVISIA